MFEATPVVKICHSELCVKRSYCCSRNIDGSLGRGSSRNVSGDLAKQKRMNGAQRGLRYRDPPTQSWHHDVVKGMSQPPSLMDEMTTSPLG